MKYCQECGKEMFDDSVICPNCGTYQTVLIKSADHIPEPLTENDFEASEPRLETAQAVEVVQAAEVAQAAPPAEPASEQVFVSAAEPVFEPQTRHFYEPENVIEPVAPFEPNSDAKGQNATGSSFKAEGYHYGSTYGPGSPYGNPSPGYQGGDGTGPIYGTSGDHRFNAPGAGSYTIPRYNFWIYLLLSIVTCGIYGIYYMYKWTEDTNRLSQGVYKPSMNYIFVFLLGMVTCGIYTWVWIYQQGERLKVVGDANGIKINETGVHHLLISLLLGGVGVLVSQYIFFSNTNRLSGVYNGEISRDQANVKTSHVVPIVVGVILAIFGLATGIGVTVFAARNSYVNDYSSYSDFLSEDFDTEDFNIDELDIEGLLGDDINFDQNNDDYSDIATFTEGVVLIDNAYKVNDLNGDPALAILINWDNYSDEACAPIWTFNVEATQDGKMLEQTSLPLDFSEFDVSTYIQEVAPGDSVDFPVIFKLINEEEDVEVIVRSNSSDDGNRAVCTFIISD